MKTLQIFDYGDTCWWCLRTADSSEHKFKRTDIVTEFGRPPYSGESALVHYVGDELVATSIQGPNSQHFKFKKGLCQFCNSTRSRPFDLAYESFVTYTRQHEESILQNQVIDLALAFGHDWVSITECMRRYFIKHACCRISDAGLRIGDDLLMFLNDENPKAPFYLFAEIRADILERLGKGTSRLGSLWLGDLMGWHAPDDSHIIRIESFYGMGCLRFYWTYDPLVRNWPDNMSDQLVPLTKRRNLDTPRR